jgi:rare lipoprotein A
VPATGWASSGGSGGSGGSGIGGGSGLTPVGSGGGNQAPDVQSGNVTVSTSGDGVTLQTLASAMLRKGLTFTGTAAQNLAGDTLEIERSGHETNWQWAPTVSTTIAPGGSFAAVWHTNHIGQFAIRAVISSSSTVAQSADNTPALTITVYRPSLATQYGPGFYGRRTACGEKLSKGMIGLANRTLKCGTKVAVYYQGRTLTVPVIDRGPYANGADWDLTMATGRALGIAGTAQIGAVSLPQPPVTSAVAAKAHQT